MVIQLALSGYCRGNPGLQIEALGLSLVRIIVLLQSADHILSTGSAMCNVIYICDQEMIKLKIS